jgi:hypothetical protein
MANANGIDIGYTFKHYKKNYANCIDSIELIERPNACYKRQIFN